MIRRRDLYASATVCAVSFAWSILVVAYCVGTSSRQRHDRSTLKLLQDKQSSIETALEELQRICESLNENQSYPESLEPDTESVVPVFEPRLIARGKSRSGGSSPAYYLWEDYEQEDGSTQRRYVARIPIPQSEISP